MNKLFGHHIIVRQEHLNQYGYLFGGHVLSIIDELAYVASVRTFPGRNFVTRAIKHAEFMAPARLGDLIEFQFGVEKVGRTSVQVRVKMYVRCGGCKGGGKLSFDGKVIMVCVDAQGVPSPIQSSQTK
jgi:acyl-CoA hydrolase